MSQQNVEIVRRVYEAAARRDTAAVFSLYDSDVEWDGSQSRWAEVLQATPRFRGHEELRKFFRQYFEMWEGFEDDLEELIDAGDHVISVVTSRGRGRASGVEVEWAGNAGSGRSATGRSSVSSGFRAARTRLKPWASRSR
jgi:ketosteroid isomerase-like protein